jgi:hypothetical protein
MKKILTIPGHKGNANQNHTKISTSLLLEQLLSKTPPTTNVSKDMGEKGTLIHCWWECKLVQPLWKNNMEASYKTKHRSAM